MLTVAYYFLQVCLCSAVMMGYYALVLRNKRFHQYNRFYLLGVAVFPWLVPLIKIEINKPLAAPTLPVQLFSVIADANSEFEHTVAAKGFQLTWDTAAMLLYATISTVFLLMLVVALVKIYGLLKHNSYKHLNDVYLVLTKANGTPFSFFKFIFWNAEIDVNTHTGKQMLEHELTHVQERHSADKLLMQLVIIIGWFNPIFWLLKRELETIHEFIADNKTIQNGDTATLATMLLTAAYPQQKFALTNPFFYSPIKRRIAMLTNNKHPKFSYARRVVVLPLLVAITLLFAFRKKEDKPVVVSMASVMEKMADVVTDLTEVTLKSNKKPTNFAPVILNKTYTVVIDAGHGGADAGAPGIDGKSYEKDIALNIVKLIKQSNRNANINIVLTRDNDVTMTPPERVDYANKIGADLLVSVHCNTADKIRKNGEFIENPARGYEVCLPSNDRVGMNDCKLLASSINNALSKHSFSVGKVTQKKVGIWILKATNCPATLVECGYISNADDLKQLKTQTYQQEMATNILVGIETYLANKESDKKAVVVDTLPNKKVLKGTVNNEYIISDYTKSKDSFFGKDEYLMPGDTLSIKPIKIDEVTEDAIIVYKKNVITKEALVKLSKLPFTTFKLSLIKTVTNIKKYGALAKNGVINVQEIYPFLIIIDGKETDKRIDDIDPNQIKEIVVLKDKKAIDKYGEKGAKGVIEVFLKKDVNDTISVDKLFTEVQIPAEFPGGKVAWEKYLERNLKIPEEAKTKNAPAGKYTVTVSFTVNEDGSISNIKALTDPGFGTVDAAIALIAKSPRWSPAVQNGRKVNYLVKQVITFQMGDKRVTTQTNNQLDIAVATQRVTATDLKKFQQVSPTIFQVYWIGSTQKLTIKIEHKTGLVESYNLYDAKSKELALAKYNQSILFNCKTVLAAIEKQRKEVKA